MTTKIPAELSSTPGIADSSNATAITIDSSERIGVGTTSPTYKLDVKHDNVGEATVAQFGGDNVNNIHDVRIYNSSQASGSLDEGVRLIFQLGNTNTGWIQAFKTADGTSAANRSGGLAFHTSNANSVTEKLRISPGGNILMGTTTVDTSYRLRLDAGGNSGTFIEDIGNGYSGIVTKPNASNNYFAMYMLNNAGAGVGYILSTSSGTTFSQSGSDIAFKENIKDWNENVLDSFKNIKPSTFSYKSDEDKKEVKGYIAQNEVDKFPEAYPINPKDGKHWFNPSGMTVYLMKAIQELSAKVEELESKINE
jgi:hypothetical protein